MAIDWYTGKEEDFSGCIYSIAEMEARGFRIVQATRTICCTEVHFNGPFHLEFSNGDVVQAVQIASTEGIDYTHQVVLTGGLAGMEDKVAFRAVPS